MLQIFEQHKQEWDHYFNERFTALQALDAAQWQIARDRKQMGFVPVNKWKHLLHKERRLWMAEWGMNGVRAKAIRDQQAADLADSYLSPEELQVFHELLGCQDWEELKKEQLFIREVYQKNDLPIPTATLKRMVMEIDLYHMGWNGIRPELETQQWSILDKDDLRHEFTSWNDLWDGYFIMSYFYGGAELLPLSYKKRMAFEIEQFWKEVDPLLSNLK